MGRDDISSSFLRASASRSAPSALQAISPQMIRSGESASAKSRPRESVQQRDSARIATRVTQHLSSSLRRAQRKTRPVLYETSSLAAVDVLRCTHAIGCSFVAAMKMIKLSYDTPPHCE